MKILLATVILAADYVSPYPPPPPPVVIQRPPPAVVVPAVPVPLVPRCRIVRETQHDDILNTDNWIEREECDED